jgi:hypothetical protein
MHMLSSNTAASEIQNKQLWPLFYLSMLPYVCTLLAQQGHCMCVAGLCLLMLTPSMFTRRLLYHYIHYMLHSIRSGKPHSGANEAHVPMLLLLVTMTRPVLIDLIHQTIQTAVHVANSTSRLQVTPFTQLHVVHDGLLFKDKKILHT